jgi:hypothetical protein
LRLISVEKKAVEDIAVGEREIIWERREEEPVGRALAKETLKKVYISANTSFAYGLVKKHEI